MLSQQISDREIGVAYPGLFEQADIVKELFELAIDDFVAHGFGLIRSLGGVDFTLLLDQRFSQLFTPDDARTCRRHLHGDLTQKALKLRGLGDEVGFAVEFNHHADLAASVDIGANRAFRRDPARPFCGLRDTFLAQPHDGPFKVARGFGECLFAIHYARAGLVAQLSYQYGVDFHQLPSIKCG
jgi:hypothetical protein